MQPTQTHPKQSTGSPANLIDTPEAEPNAFSLVNYMQAAFMTPLGTEGKSLHQMTITLPFYAKLLRTNDISDKELLQHFVNNSAIFTKLESLIRLHVAFRKVFTDEIFRATKAEEDISFFIERFHLKRPDATQEVKDFLGFIDRISEENPQLLLPIFYVQYAGLFLGRAVYGATAKWLAPKIDAWAELPAGKKGVSYWDFEGLPTSVELQARSATLLKDIDAIGTEWGMKERMREIAGEAFQHNFNVIKSAASFASLAQRNVTPNAQGMTGEQKRAVVITLMIFVFAFLVNEAMKFRSTSTQ